MPRLFVLYAYRMAYFFFCVIWALEDVSARLGNHGTMTDL